MQVAEDAEKSEAEKARLQAERAAGVAALRESQQQLAHKLEKIESDKVEAARLAEKRAKQDAKRLAEAHAKLKEESAAIVAKQQAKVAELKAKLEGLRLHHESVQADASSKIEEEAARKTEAEELVQFQIEQAERAAAQTNTQVVELRQQVAKFEQMLLCVAVVSPYARRRTLTSPCRRHRAVPQCRQDPSRVVGEDCGGVHQYHRATGPGERVPAPQSPLPSCNGARRGVYGGGACS